MIITIDDNIHSGGVSLQLAKEEKILYPKINFFLLEWRKLLINDMFQREKKLIALRLLSIGQIEYLKLLHM